MDATGLVRNRSIGDIMRYAAINEGLDTLSHCGDFQPALYLSSALFASFDVDRNCNIFMLYGGGI